MSRYLIRPKDFKLGVCVGWDNPLQTFFIQVEDQFQEDESKSMLLWVGATPGELLDVEEVAKLLEPYATLTEDIKQRMKKDYENRTEQSHLQKFAIKNFCQGM